jgi:hypothetical protein
MMAFRTSQQVDNHISIFFGNGKRQATFAEYHVAKSAAPAGFVMRLLCH